MNAAQDAAGEPALGAQPGTPGTPGGGDSRDLLTARLLPTLLHALNNHTQFLTGLNSVLSLADGRVLHERAADLEQTSRDVEDAGWMLAVLASACGANLLLTRREPRGLEIAGGLVDHSLRRDGGASVCPDRGWPWPALAPDVLDGWQLTWAIGSLLLAAGLDAQGTERVDWGLRASDGGALLDLPSGGRVRAVSPIVEEVLGGVRAGSDGTRCRLQLPAGWLVFAGDPR